MKMVNLHPPGYYDVDEHAYNERTLNTYKSMVFRDTTHNRWFSKKPEYIKPEDPMYWSLRNLHRIDHFTFSTSGVARNPSINYDWDWPSNNIFGGLDGFFSEKVSVLDLGSGHGRVVEEINKKYANKQITCMGLDYRYIWDKPGSTDNLVAGDFRHMPFKDKTFDRLLSVESFPAWLPKDRGLIKEYLEDIKRVSKTGTIWRGTLPTNDGLTKPFIENHDLIQEFVKIGWEVVVIYGGTPSFVALLV